MPNTKSYHAIMEIDSERGVIYIHSAVKGHTLLRICQLPSPIPDPGAYGQGIDITHMKGCGWRDPASQTVVGASPKQLEQAMERALILLRTALLSVGSNSPESAGGWCVHCQAKMRAGEPHAEGCAWLLREESLKLVTPSGKLR